MGPVTSLPRLALFDLDHTLLVGDSDVLWCDFLMDEGVLDRSHFGPRNAALAQDYRAGRVSAQDFCGFYVATLAGRSAADWAPLRRRFFDERVRPLIPQAALALVQQHLDAGDLVVLTTATNRYLTELTAAHLGISDLIATECETDAQGQFTGRIGGVLNMREGKLARLHAWLAGRGSALADFDSAGYSDSINDLPLLAAVNRAVAVNADEQLAREATARGWPSIQLTL